MYNYYEQKKPFWSLRNLSSFTSIAVIILQSLSVLAVAYLTQPADAVTNYTEYPFTASEVATNWFTDRSTPSGGYSSVSHAGRDDVLLMSVDNDLASATTGFYRTEGLKKDITDSDSIRADLYVDSNWLTKPVRAGLWGVGYNASSDISSYPIVEFTTIGDGSYTGWRTWDGVLGGWTNLPGVSYTEDGWNTLEIKHNKTSELFDISINGTWIQSNTAGSTVAISEVILNSFNSATTAADNYDVYWSKFAVGEYTDDVQTESTVPVYGDTSMGKNLPGWLFNRDVTTATPYEFNSEASSIGNGSLYILPITNSSVYGDKDKFIAEFFDNTPISELNSVSYDFQIGTGGVPADENEFYMSVYANFGESSDTKFYDCRYNVVPTVGLVGDFTTVVFDPNLEYPVTKSGSSPHNCPSSPADMDISSIGSTIRTFALNVGDTSNSDQDLDGYLDKFVYDTVNEITTYDFEPDISPPVTIFSSPINDSAVSTTQVSGVITDNLEVVQYSFNITGPYSWSTRKWTPNTDAVNFDLNLCQEDRLSNCDETTLPEGEYRVRVAAYDDSSNRDISTNVTFVYDKTAPTITVKPESVGTEPLFQKVSYKLFDAHQIDKVEINGVVKDLTNNNWSDVNNIAPGVFGAVEGDNTIVVYDVAGNTTTHEFVLDITPPAKPTVLGIYKGHNSNVDNFLSCGGVTNSTQIRIDWADNAESDLDHYWFGTKFNSHHRKLSVSQYNANMTPGNNPYYYTVIAVDKAGNESLISDNCGLILDQEAPDAFNVSYADGSVVNGVSVVQEWGSTATDVDYYIYESYHDSAATGLRWREEISSTSKTATNVANATYWWRVRSVDLAGNMSDWSPLWKLTIDNTAPDALISNPSDSSLVRGVVNVIGEVTDDNPMNTYFRITGPNDYEATDFYSDGRSVHQFEWDTSGLEDGVYNIRFEARDKASNKDSGSVTEITVEVDNTAPTTDFEGLTTSDPTPIITGDAGDADSLVVTIDGVEYTATPVAGLWTVNVAFPLAIGTYDVLVEATDIAGNTSIANYANSLSITATSPTPTPTTGVLGATDDNSEANGDGSSQSNGGIGGSFNSFAFVDESENQINETENENTSAESTAQVLQSNTAGSGSDAANIENEDALNEECFKVFGVCWYWLVVPTIAVVAYMYYRMRDSAE